MEHSFQTPTVIHKIVQLYKVFVIFCSFDLNTLASNFMGLLVIT